MVISWNSTELDISANTTDSFNVSSSVENSSIEPMKDSASGASFSRTVLPYILIASIGVAGNVLVIVVIANSREMRRRFTNIIIMNQSALDITASVMLIKFILVDRAQLVSSGFLGELKCRLWLGTIFMWAGLVSSTYNLVALTIERYIAIIHPVVYRNRFNRTHALMMCLGAWLSGPVLYLAMEIPTGGVQDGICYRLTFYHSDGWKKLNGVVSFIVQLLVPLFVFAYCYTRMIIDLNFRVAPRAGPVGAHGDAVSTVQAHAVKPYTVKNKLARARRNILKTLLVVVICFTVCWSWNQIYFFSLMIGYEWEFMTNLDTINLSAFFVFANCCINPFIYTCNYEMFQIALRKMFCRRCMLKNKVISITGSHPLDVDELGGTSTCRASATVPSTCMMHQ